MTANVVTNTNRPDLSNTALRKLSLALIVALVVAVLTRPWLPPAWQQPGSPLLQSLAAIGAVLLLAPFLFLFGKRSGASAVPNRLFVLHVGASLSGMLLIWLHAQARLEGPPLLLLLCLALLFVSGMLGRVRLAPRMAATFGSKPGAFAGDHGGLREQIRGILEQKTELLQRLDPAANEALFSVTLGHWLRAPRLSLAYTRLTRRESRLIGARQSVPWLQAWWRPLHIAIAWLFLGGLLLHVILVLFFAGYVADGREITWWHLRA